MFYGTSLKILCWKLSVGMLVDYVFSYSDVDKLVDTNIQLWRMH